MKGFIEARRTPDTAPLDVIGAGLTLGDDPAAGAEIVRHWAEAGATWWLEANWSEPERSATDTRIRQGLPRHVQVTPPASP